MPGRVFRPLAEKAMEKAQMAIAVEASGEDQHRLAYLDLDLCDALADPRLKNVGAGFTAYVQLDGPEPIERLLGWIRDDDPRDLRLFRETIQGKLADLKAAEKPDDEEEGAD